MKKNIGCTLISILCWSFIARAADTKTGEFIFHDVIDDLRPGQTANYPPFAIESGDWLIGAQGLFGKHLARLKASCAKNGGVVSIEVWRNGNSGYAPFYALPDDLPERIAAAKSADEVVCLYNPERLNSVDELKRKCEGKIPVNRFFDEQKLPSRGYVLKITCRLKPMMKLEQESSPMLAPDDFAPVIPPETFEPMMPRYDFEL